MCICCIDAIVSVWLCGVGAGVATLRSIRRGCVTKAQTWLCGVGVGLAVGSRYRCSCVVIVLPSQLHSSGISFIAGQASSIIVTGLTKFCDWI